MVKCMKILEKKKKGEDNPEENNKPNQPTNTIRVVFGVCENKILN